MENNLKEERRIGSKANWKSKGRDHGIHDDDEETKLRCHSRIPSNRSNTHRKNSPLYCGSNNSNDTQKYLSLKHHLHNTATSQLALPQYGTVPPYMHHLAYSRHDLLHLQATQPHHHSQAATTSRTNGYWWGYMSRALVTSLGSEWLDAPITVTMLHHCNGTLALAVLGCATVALRCIFNSIPRQHCPNAHLGSAVWGR